MDSLDDILAAAENPAFVRVATARVLLRQDLLARKDELEEAIKAEAAIDARENRTPVALGLAREMEALDAEIEEAKVEFKFRSVGKRAWADLLAANPPTKEQSTRIRGLDHNPLTFPCAAVALSYVDPVDPGWVPDQKGEVFAERYAKFVRLFDRLNTSQWEALWSKCIDANLGGLDTPKSQAASLLLRLANSRSATTAVPEESLAVSSSGE